MARTVDAAAHAIRRDEFLDAAERLLKTKGFERASVQDVLDETGASKGAFYHYFSSKQDLLQALAERLADVIASNLQQAADAPELSAPDRLNRLFAALGSTKMQRRDTILALLRVWYSDSNAAVRIRLRAGISNRIAPLLTSIITQGKSEGTFPTEPVFGRVLASLIQDLNDAIGQRFLLSEERGESIDDLTADIDTLIATYTSAMERILGAVPGSIQLVDPDMIRAWIQSADMGEEQSC